MINSNKKWLLTASPWMKNSFWLSPLAISGILLTALLVFSSQVSRAQTLTTTLGHNVGTMHTVYTQDLPAIAGTNTLCWGVGPTTTTLSDATAGGTWSSSNTAVGTIGSSGSPVTFTALAPGVTNIYYTIGTHVAITTITVTYPITGLSSGCVGNPIQLTDATATGIWTSSSPSVATVSVTGLVSTVAPGTTTISFGRTGACVETMVVTVNPNTVGNITGSVTPIGVCVGGTTTLNDTSVGGTWSSGTTAVGTIGSATGIAGGISAGVAIITFTKTSTGCYKTAPFIVSATGSVHGIHGVGTVCTGNVTSLTDSTLLGTWTSKNTSIALVNSAGGVTGVSSGIDTIMYSKGGCSVLTIVTVNTNTLSLISGSTNVCLGGTATLTDASGAGTWSSSNTAIGTVGSATGVVGGITTGNTIITYFNSGCYKTTAITVNTVAIPAISSPGGVCLGSTVTLTDANPGGTWSSATPATATINAYGVVTGLTSGTDVITYTLLGCTTTTTITVNVLPPSISGTLSVCTGLTTTLTDATGGGTWMSGNVTVGTVDPSSGIVTGIGMGTARITYTAGGCMTSSVITVNPISPINGGNVACLYTSGAYLELFDVTGGGVWVSSTPLVAAIAPTTGIVTANSMGTTTISYTTAAGCMVTKIITVNPAPVAITGNLIGCAGSTLTLADTSGASTGTWSSSNTAVGTISVGGVVTGIDSGYTTISYTLAGCAATANVSFSKMPTPILGSNTVCTGLAVITLSDTTAGGTWTASNTFIHIDASGNVTGVGVGTSTVSYIKGGCARTMTVSVNANPVSSVIGLTYVCQGQTTTLFDATPSGVWSTSNNAIGTIGSVSGIVTGIVAGPMVITYTTPGNGCFKTMVFAVDTMPSAISGPFSVCTYNSITLSDAYAGGGWSSGNTSVATVSNGVVTGITSGATTITYAKGMCAVYQPVSVYANTISTPSGTLCSGITSTTLTATPAGGTWASSNSAIASVVSGTGVVTGGATLGVVNITYSTTGCYGTYTVNAVPSAILGTGVNTVCVGDTIMLSDTTVAGTWRSSSSSKASVTTAGIVTGVAAGTAKISYSVFGCPATVIVTVNANTITVSGSTSMCVSGTTTLTATPVGGTWSGSNTYFTVDASGDIAGLVVGNPMVTYAQGACYLATALNINPLPAAITGNVTACIGIVDTMRDASIDGTWTISNANATITGGTFGAVIGVTAGSATVTYALNATGCATTFVVSVTASPAAISVAASGKVCMGSTLALTDATAGGVWSSSDNTFATVGSTGTGATATATPVAVGSAIITYMNTTTGCYAAKSISIGTTPGPILGPTTVCTGASILISDATLGGSWTVTSGAANVTIATWSAPYEFVLGSVAGTSVFAYTTPGCVAQTYTITVNASPGAITGVFSACIDTLTTLADTTTGGTWASSDITLATIDASLGIVTPLLAGLPTITYTAPNGCIATQPFDVSACGHRWSNPAGGSNGTVTTQKYSLYPNPSSGSVTIMQSLADDKQMSVTIVNYAGATVQTGAIQFSGGKGELNILNVSAGMYLVMLRDDKGELQTFKVVIEK